MSPLCWAARGGAYFRRLIKPSGVFLLSKFSGSVSIFSLVSYSSDRQRGKEASERMGVVVGRKREAAGARRDQ